MVAHPGKILPGALLALSIFTGGAPAAQDPRQAVKAEENLSGLHDFDFLIGDWRVRHRLIQGGQWVEFDGTSSTRKLMGGYGNVEDNVLQRPGGSYKAVGLRSYDSKSGQWAIWWLDGRNPLGLLDPAVKGRFVNGIGNFYADDMLNGKPIRVRYTWSHITPAAARWEQAFSVDAGATWETNWVMEFERVA